MNVARSLRSWLSGAASAVARQFRRPPAPKKSTRGRQERGTRRRLLASYDAADSTVENSDRWPGQDSLNANAGQDYYTRQTLRERSRNEVQNNSYAAGLVEGMANDVVGTGPRLQLSIPGIDRETCRALEQAWASWARAVDLAEDLRVLHKSRLTDGEGFAVLFNNPVLLASGLTSVSLDLRLYETDQITDPFDFGLDPNYVDGIRLDPHGNPVSYCFLKNHPGGVFPFVGFDTQTIDARDVLHWYKSDRPGQSRGIPALTPGLPLLAQIRRYTLATLSAAELAATLAGIMKTNTAAPDGGGIKVDTLQDIDLVRGSLLTLPEGWDATQFKPEQPVSTYGEFKREVLNEFGRGLNTPFNVVTGNSSGYNYSSGRLDHLLYRTAVRVERSRLEQRILLRIFLAWVQEALLAGVVRGLLPKVDSWSVKWFWDQPGSIDPLKDAQTDQIELATGTTTLAEVYARKGQDWEEALRQRARELKLAIDLERQLGLPAGSLSGLKTTPTIPPDPTDQNQETGSNAEPATAA